MKCCNLKLTVETNDTVALKVVGGEGRARPTYEGPYEFNPSAQIQTVAIAKMVAREDIVINPIPSNYGLITWDGSTLTVS